MTEPGGDSLAEMLDERQHLLEIARSMLDSDLAADHVVEETYRRWYCLDTTERADIAGPRAWLARTAGSICLGLVADPGHGISGPPRAPDHHPDPDGRWAGPGHGSTAEHERVARRFVAACQVADTRALRSVLATDAVVVTDGGGKVRAAVHPICGADGVARFVAALLFGRSGTEVSPGSVNGRPGLVLRRAGRTVAVVSLSVTGQEVTAVWMVLNPAKLRHWL